MEGTAKAPHKAEEGVPKLQTRPLLNTPPPLDRPRHNALGGPFVLTWTLSLNAERSLNASHATRPQPTPRHATPCHAVRPAVRPAVVFAQQMGLLSKVRSKTFQKAALISLVELVFICMRQIMSVSTCFGVEKPRLRGGRTVAITH